MGLNAMFLEHLATVFMVVATIHELALSLGASSRIRFLSTTVPNKRIVQPSAAVSKKT